MEAKKTAFGAIFCVRKNKSKGLEVPIQARVTFDGTEAQSTADAALCRPRLH